MKPKYLFYCLCVLFMWSCQKSSGGSSQLYMVRGEGSDEIVYSGELSDEIVVQIESDPPSLHPTNATTSYRSLIMGLVTQQLHVFDITQPGEIIAQIADGLPEALPDGKSYLIKIHPQAAWPDGAPITGEDILFTLKAIACPLTNNAPQKGYLEYLDNATLSPENPQHILFTFREYYINNQYLSLISSVLDRRKYDPEGILAKRNLQDFLGASSKSLAEDPDIKTWAAFFNDGKLGKELEWLNYGSGPYEVAEWSPEQQIVLVRRENYWGKELPGHVHRAYPPKITFKILREDASVELQIKEQKIDVAHLSVQSQKNLLGSPLANEHYHFVRPAKASVAMIVWNLRPESGDRAPIFNDVRVRRAVALALPLDSILAQHFAMPNQRALSPVSPANPDHNDTIRGIPHDPVQAKALLTEAGWSDSDGDFVLDKMMDGRQVDLAFEIYYAPNSQAVEDVMTRMETELAKVGVKLMRKPASMQEYLPQVQNHQFDAAIISMGSSDLPYDFKQVYHSDSWGGSNLFGYRNPQVDEWIDQARVETDPGVRKDLVDKIQAQLYYDQPCLFFFHPRSELALHKRFSGGTIHRSSPHILLNNLQVIRP